MLIFPLWIEMVQGLGEQAAKVVDFWQNALQHWHGFKSHYPQKVQRLPDICLSVSLDSLLLSVWAISPNDSCVNETSICKEVWLIDWMIDCLLLNI